MIELYKEFALGVSNRHNFQAVDKISDWMGTDSDTFMSLYDMMSMQQNFMLRISLYQDMMD